MRKIRSFRLVCLFAFGGFLAPVLANAQVTSMDATNAVTTLGNLANYAGSTGLPIGLGLLGISVVVGIVVMLIGLRKKR
jgi:hypothetical protein